MVGYRVSFRRRQGRRRRNGGPRPPFRSPLRATPEGGGHTGPPSAYSIVNSRPPLRTSPRAVEADLQLRHVPFERRDLIAFAEDVWPLVLAEDGSDQAHWAPEFLKRQRVRAKFRDAAAEGRALYVPPSPREG
jgi:hypothetical protein